MEILSSYIPMDRRQALANGTKLSTKTKGSVLFADVSGFTPLTAALTTELGLQRGAEAITEQLNQVYTTLIAQIHRYHGSVVGFVGDAITCCFNQDNGLQAAACALSMQKTMEPFKVIRTPAGTEISLAVKVVVINGPFRRFVVGNPKFGLIDAIAGETLNKVNYGNQNANKGEVLLDAELAKQLEAYLNISTWRTDEESNYQYALVNTLKQAVPPAPWPYFNLSRLKNAEHWILPAVYQRIKTGQEQFLAEIRPAVALFLRFSGLDYDHDEKVGRKLDAYIRWVQEILARYDGVLIQLTIGDKGSFLYAVFGAPVAHDDDPVRAVNAAFLLQNTPFHLNFITQVQLGLTYGQMRTGAYGSATRRTYGVIGDKTNLAARLMGAAKPGQVLCDFDIYRQSEHVISFKTLTPIRVKGKAGLIRVYEPSFNLNQTPSEITFLTAKSPLVGREKELAYLQKTLDNIESGAGQVLIIEGEAGIGKSRLIVELAQLIQAKGLIGLLGTGLSTEQKTLYRVWRDIFGSYFDINQITDSEQCQKQIKNFIQAIAPDQLERLPLLNDMLNLGFADNTLTLTLDSTSRCQNLIILITALLQAWAEERPLIIVLEDAHWLDSLSWHLTQQVIRSLNVAEVPFLFVIVTRPIVEYPLVAESLASIQAMPITKTFSLSTLNLAQTTNLITQRLNLPLYGLPQEISHFVYNQANGNPFFAEELIFFLRDAQIISIESIDTPFTPSSQLNEADFPVISPKAKKIIPPNLSVQRNSVSLDSVNQLITSKRCVIKGDLARVRQSIPDTLHGLILSRLDRLPLQQQIPLKVAAVIGRIFAYPPLYYVVQQYTNTKEETLKDYLQTLAERDFIALETSTPYPTYIFKHIVTREVAYQTLLFAQRKELHRLVADWYKGQLNEQISKNENNQVDPSLTSPFVLQSPYLPLLTHHYNQAEDHEQERYYAKLSGEQAAAQFANEEAVRYFTQALTLTPKDDLKAQYTLILNREKVYHLLGKRESQQADLDTLADLASALIDNKRQIEVYLKQARYYQEISNYSRSIMAAKMAIGLAQQGDNKLGEAEGYLIWGRVLHEQGNYEESQRYQQKALALYEQVDDKRGKASALNNLGSIALYQGDYDLAHDYYQQTLFLRHLMGDRKGEAGTLSNLGIMAGYLGDYVLSKEYFEQGLIIAKKVGGRITESRILNSLGFIYYLLGNYEQAKICYQQALTISKEIEYRTNQSAILSNLGLLYHYLGDNKLAQTYSEEAISISQETKERYYQAQALFHLGHALTDLGQVTQASNAYHQALSLWQEDKYKRYTMDPLAGLANLALRERKLDEALQFVEQILTYQEINPTFEGAEEPLRICLICYRVLQANRNPKAYQLLKTTYELLKDRAAKISDPEIRHAFLYNVVTHEQIMTTWRMLKRQTAFLT